jgi:hypothetical protein
VCNAQIANTAARYSGYYTWHFASLIIDVVVALPSEHETPHQKTYSPALRER